MQLIIIIFLEISSHEIVSLKNLVKIVSTELVGLVWDYE